MLVIKKLQFWQVLERENTTNKNWGIIKMDHTSLNGYVKKILEVTWNFEYNDRDFFVNLRKRLWIQNRRYQVLTFDLLYRNLKHIKDLFSINRSAMERN